MKPQLNHEAQLEWAKSIGGDLPTRIEPAMLWDKYQFESDWYWSWLGISNSATATRASTAAAASYALVPFVG